MSDPRYSPPRASVDTSGLERGEGAPPGEPLRIGGWLYLVALGLSVTAIRGTYQMYSVYWPIFRDGYWPKLTTAGGAGYHVLWAPLIVGEIVGNLCVIALSVFALAHFFRKSRKTPRAAVVCYSFGVALVLLDYFVSGFIPAVANNRSASNSELFRACFSAAIWIPYFLVSKRVKNTFVR